MASLIADASLASEILHKCKAELIIVTFGTSPVNRHKQGGEQQEGQTRRFCQRPLRTSWSEPKTTVFKQPVSRWHKPALKPFEWHSSTANDPFCQCWRLSPMPPTSTNTANSCQFRQRGKGFSRRVELPPNDSCRCEPPLDRRRCTAPQSPSQQQ